MTLPESAWVQSDQGVIERIVSSLLRNAIEYAPEGDDIQCRLERVASGWMLTIVNTAPNLQASDLDQFGLRFWRKDSEGGTVHHAGLGLALAGARTCHRPAAGVLAGQRCLSARLGPWSPLLRWMQRCRYPRQYRTPTPAVTAMANVPQNATRSTFEERRTTHGSGRGAAGPGRQSPSQRSNRADSALAPTEPRPAWPHGEASCGRYGGLQRASAQGSRNAQFIARARRIMRHQLRGDLIRESMIQAAGRRWRQFPVLCFRTVLQFITFPRQVCLLVSACE